MQVYVTMTDLYARTYFNVETPSLSIEDITQALEDNYEEWSSNLSHQGAGSVHVYHEDKEVATGSLVWWWFGTHTLRLDVPRQEQGADKLARLTDYLRTEHSRQACP